MPTFSQQHGVTLSGTLSRSKPLSMLINSTGKLLAGFLLMLPLLLIGLLALYGWHLEIQTLQDTRQQLMRKYLQQTEIALQQTLNEQTDQAVGLALAALQTDELDTPRNLLLRNNLISLIIAYQQERRLFPPEESARQFPVEQNRLAMLTEALQTARSTLVHEQRYRQQIRDIYHQQRATILHCQQAGEQQICVLLQTQTLWQALQAVLLAQNASHPEWSLKLTDTAAESDQHALQSLLLAPPLQGWHLHIEGHENSSIQWGYLNGLVIIIGPLLLSWAYLAWSFYRRQQADLQATAQRAELTAQLSHELRTPLANLSLYTELLQRKSTDPAVTQYVTILQQELERLGKLTENTIDAARGKPKPAYYASASPDQLIQQLLTNFCQLWAQAGCEIHFSGQADLTLEVDQAALESILLQLLDNACKYASPGQIDIHTWYSDGLLYLQVRDYGEGLAETELNGIFNPEIRGQQTDQIQGFGMGLAAARYFSRLNAGDLTVENAEPGLRFTATLTAREPA